MIGIHDSDLFCSWPPWSARWTRKGWHSAEETSGLRIVPPELRSAPVESTRSDFPV
jgi:hypothetical protein